MVEDEAAGVLTLYATETGIFDQEEVDSLMDLASDIGRAMAYIDKSEQLNFLAYHDILTGLCNRTMLHEHLTQEVAHAQRLGTQAAVVFIDLDNFKLVNDSLGHSAGDRLLKITADRLLSCLRDVDTVARQGGDEFVVLLPDQANPDMVSSALERILEAVAKPVSIDGKQINVTCSMGVSIYPRDGMDADTLLKNADAAMYRAKEIGRNNFQFYASEMNARVNDRLALQSSLRRALDREEFFLHYQPQIDIGSGQVIAAEALVRWAHPELGLVPPGRFIPLAEESGLIGPLGEWVLQAACSQIKGWRATGVQLARVAVNLSARQFRGAGLDRQVERVLSATGIEPQALELELTESMLMQHGEEVIAVLQNLREMGVKLAIDDFGTGYSSLSYLRRFPVNRLKIDRSFVRDIASNADDAAITNGIISLAHSIHLRVVAEGVETAEQLEVLREAGCDEAQGYYLGRPMPAPEMITALGHTEVESSRMKLNPANRL
jgi:diguanylate cyclase (GGDEF)-like protein